MTSGLGAAQLATPRDIVVPETIEPLTGFQQP